MVRSVPAKTNGKQASKNTPKSGRNRKKSRPLLANVVLGAGLVVAALIGASIVTVATSVKSAPDVRLEMTLASPVAVQPVVASVADRDLDISKFSRLPGSATAEPKGRRLEGAELAALETRRPDQSSVRRMLDMAMVNAARDSQAERQFAALEKLRPDTSAIRAVLGPAMESLVVVAPRNSGAENGALPDLIQDAVSTTTVAELKDMKPVEMAALEDLSDDAVEEEDGVETAEAPAPAPVIAQLPRSGPMPVIRPGAPRPNALAAIAAVAPQGREQGREKPDSEKPTVLAFAKPDNPMRNAPAEPAPSAPSWPGIGSKVAIYDITNAVVHMPNGTKLEAHSGIGSMRDNPKFTHVKMRGPTPPGTYKLSMRETLFHGVAAIRLTSVDGKHPQNRTGLLAHSFLLRVRGDSHGCVAFADYDKFLKAFQRGDITHMVIVPKWDGKRPGAGPKGGDFLAKLFGGSDA